MPMNDPFSSHHILMQLGHVVLDLVESDVLVAVEYDALDDSVRTVDLVAEDALKVSRMVTPAVLAGNFQFQFLKLL